MTNFTLGQQVTNFGMTATVVGFHKASGSLGGSGKDPGGQRPHDPQGWPGYHRIRPSEKAAEAAFSRYKLHKTSGISLSVL